MLVWLVGWLDNGLAMEGMEPWRLRLCFLRSMGLYGVVVCVCAAYSGLLTLGYTGVVVL